MVTTVGWFYLVGGTVLFFFWAYGIVSFVLDVKNKFIPAARALVAARRRDENESEPRGHEQGPTPRDLQESDPDEADQQLY